MPGIAVGLAIMIVCGITSYMRGYGIPEKTSATRIVKSLFDALPSLLLVIIVIGGILSGFFSPGLSASGSAGSP